ncbi:DNA-binding response regulator [Paenibacillus oralis]|uniref:DNA-binding response regulator n=1 Tax=Paenibacillus oralis TaxID=2490856 RepID=A0A3P3U9R0_9BACL|nr:response regulator transcription factor [Paenibacillus oralis]RRJ66884.1 DNA-binding response regulator [Paenibacillus oralis]
MIKVLIVDDEPKLREGLRTFIDWNALGYDVVDTAANGNEALDKYRRHHPGLVVADIRMPGMDGLQLIEKLRSEDPQLHILILSGYADFSYAKQAMTQRVDGYLLKPVDEDELEEYLAKIKKAVDEETASEEWKHVTAEWTRESLIQSVLAGADEQQTVPICERAGEVGITGKVYQVLLLAVHAEDDADLGAGELLRKKLGHMFEDTGRGWVFGIQAKLGVLLKDPLLAVEYESVYREIREELNGTGAEFTAALGNKVGCLPDIRSSYLEACELIKRHFFLDQGAILSPEALRSGAPSELPDASIEEIGEQLYYALDIGNQEAIQSLVRKAGQTLAAGGCPEKEIKRRFVEVLTLILGKALKQSSALQDRSKEFSDFLSEIHKMRTIEGLYEKTEFLLQQIMHQLGEGGKHREVKIMLDLIHRNFNENLKLETLSGIFNYNSAYLGKLFKNATGEYFNTYLDKVRIEKAKAYLEEGLKVYQVAEKVGYTNVDYFHSKFRKYVGTSPSAYRKTASNA